MEWLSNSGIHLRYMTTVVQTRPLQGLSTDVLDSGLWWKSPPLPQNTSSVVGTLKQRSISVGFLFLSEIRPIGQVWFLGLFPELS
jgi:hypothetical protein